MTERTVHGLRRDQSARARWLIAGLASVMLVGKLLLAGRTFGTNDAASWTEFARSENLVGPIRLYSLVWAHELYNHPPLIGYFLHLVNLIQTWGWPPRFTIRMVSSLADVGTALIVFELLRPRRGLKVAAASAILVAVSPVLLEVSGFHGNTDPVFTLLTLTSLWLLVDRRLPLLAGVAIGLAVGVKIIPMVVIPCLAAYAWKTGRREAVRFLAALAVVFVITWGPALLLEWRPLLRNVIGYPGTGPSRWGFIQLGHWLGDPWWVGVLTGSGRGLVVAICAVVPCVAVWRRPATIVAAAAWSLIAFLALAVSFGVQYFVWPLAACYLIEFWFSTAYNLTAGLILTEVYNRWSGGFPWYQARATKFTGLETYLFLVPWLILVAVLVRASVVIFPRRAAAGTNPKSEAATIPLAPARAADSTMRPNQTASGGEGWEEMP